MTVYERIAGREPVTIVEIDQDFCNLTYGTAPCTAAVGTTGDRKCYNTRATCQDVANYDRGALTLRFCRPQESIPAEWGAMPFVRTVQTQPTVINPGGGERRISAFGRRAQCTVTFTDAPHSDFRVDKYRGERDFDPSTRGTFWTKFLIRSPFYEGRPMRIREGYLGQDLADMTTRHYVIERIEGPDAAGNVRVTAKDILALVDRERAQAPRPANGELENDISDTAGSATLLPAGVGSEYPTSGFARLGSEVVSYTRSGDNLTLTGRGLFNTDADDHDAETTFQDCLEYDGVRVEEVIRGLLVDYGDVPTEFIPFGEWQTEGARWLPGYQLTTLITEPTPVVDLISELTEQCIVYIWWDERKQRIEFAAIRPPLPSDDIPQWDEQRNVVEGSLRVEEDPRQRISLALLYYEQRDPTGGQQQGANYDIVRPRIRADAESADQYGDRKTRTIYSRWLKRVNRGEVITTQARLLARYGRNPLRVSFRVDAKDRDVWTGDIIDMQHRSMVDDTGAPRVQRLQVISAEEVDPGHHVQYHCQTSEFVGRYAFIMQNDSPVYVEASGRLRDSGAWFAPDPSGFADGSEPYRII